MFMIALGKIPVVPPPEIAGTVGLYPTAASRAGKEKVVILSVQEAPFIRPEKRKLRSCPYKKRFHTIGKKKIAILSVQEASLYGWKKENCDFVRTRNAAHAVRKEDG